MRYPLITIVTIGREKFSKRIFPAIVEQNFVRRFLSVSLYLAEKRKKSKSRNGETASRLSVDETLNAISRGFDRVAVRSGIRQD